MNRETHDALLSRCPGYAAFVAKEQEMDPDDDLVLLVGFADWFLSAGEDADDYSGWSADDFRAEWDHWNS